MVHLRRSRFFSFLVFFALLVGPLPLTAMTESLVINASEFEMDIISKNPQESYVYFGKKASNMSDLLSHISDLDDQMNSPLHALKEYIAQGFSIIEYDVAVDILAYAESVVQRSYGLIDALIWEQLMAELECVMDKVIAGALTVEADVSSRALQLSSLTIDKDLHVLGQSVFKKHMHTKEGIHVGGKLEVDKSSLFKKNITIDDTLFVKNLSVSHCVNDLCVNNLSVVNGVIDNLSLVDLVVQNLSTTDLAVLNCMNNLCVNNLSVVDESISGTLSVNNAAIQNLIFTGSLSFTSLSVVDATVSGTLSVTDEVINGNVQISGFTPAGVVHNDALGNLSSSLIVDADVDPAAGIVDTKLATISTAGKVDNSATTATTTNTPNTIVLRDGSGNFSAGTITANLNGNATTATTTTNAVNFTGPLAGEVTGTQSATVVTNAVSANTANAIVRRTATGGFSAGLISVTDEVISSTLTVTPFNALGVVHNNASGLLSSSLIVNADVSASAAIVDTKLATISTAGKVANSATTATSANTPNTIVLRDGSGNFAAGTITATITGSSSLDVLKAGDTMTGALQLPAGTAAAPSLVFTGSSTTGLSAATVNTLAFSTAGAQRMSISAAGAVTINNLNTVGIVHNSAAGLLSTSLIVNADVDPAAAIVDTKLATISTAGKVANSATTATTTNTPNTIVLRDGSGDFSAGIITADLTGNATTATTAIDFSGSLAGEVTGTQSATVVTNAVSDDTASAIVRRSATGGFTAGSISITDGVLAGNLILTTDPSSLTAGNILKGANTFIHNFGTGNTFVGESAGNLTTSGTGQNVAIGTSALNALTTGLGNVALGYQALLANTTGSNNIAIGDSALELTTTGGDNIAIGQALFSNVTGSSNIAIGEAALENNTASNNLAIGINTIVSTTTGTRNVAVGNGGLLNNVTGNDNTAIGYNALTTQNIGTSFNTGVGSASLSSNITGASNTAVGYNTLALCIGGNNVAVGSNAGGVLTAGNNNIYIAANAALASESNTTRIGAAGTQAQCFIAGIRGVTTVNNNALAVLIDSAGQLGTVSSSRTVKHDIEDMSDISSGILKLRPVTFAYNSDESETMQYGLIAEEVDAVFPAIVIKNQHGEPETVQYHVLPVLLLNELQKQNSAMQILQQEMVSCMQRIEQLEAKA